MIDVFREDEAYLILLPGGLVRADTKEDAIKLLRENGETLLGADLCIYYAVPLPPGVEIDYVPGERLPYRVNGKPTNYDYARVRVASEGGMTQREAAAVLHAHKVAAEIGDKYK